MKAVHFFDADDRNISPQAFAQSIANQLMSTVPASGNALATTLADRASLVGTAQAGTTTSSTLTGLSICHLHLAGLGDGYS